MEGTGKPDYGRAVDILTKSAIKEMIVPSLLPVGAPIVLYFLIDFFIGRQEAFIALGAMLLGVVVTGLFVALSMTSGGGAWNNAKNSLKKEVPAVKDVITIMQQSRVILLGCYKDTAGPAINPMIKITNIVALLLLAILAAAAAH